MEYSFFKGFLLVLLTQRCTSEDLPSSIQSSMVLTHQDGQALPQEPELHSAEVAPVVVPPSLEEVKQAVQEASEQVQGRGAEEVLKELLERVVEAAMGQVDSEEKAGGAAVQEVAGEDTPWTVMGNTDEHGMKKGLEGEEISIKEGHAGVGGGHGVAVVDAVEDVAEEGKGITQEEGKITAGSVEEATVGAETGGREADGVGVISESLDAGGSEGTAEATLTVSEETGAKAAETVGRNKQDVLSNGAAETGAQDTEEAPAIVEVAVQEKPQKETEEVSDPSLSVSDVELLAGAPEKEEAQEEKTQVEELEGGLTIQSSDNYETDVAQSVAGEEEEEETLKGTKEPAVEDDQGQLVLEGGAAKEVEAEGMDVGVAAAAGGDGDRDSAVQEESMALVHERGEQQVEEEQVTLEAANDKDTEDQESLVISAPDTEDAGEAPVELNPWDQAPTPSPPRGEAGTGDNMPDDDKSNLVNEILTPTDDLSPNDPVVAKPALDNVVKDVLVEAPQSDVGEPGEANELVEDTAINTEIQELGLEAWKIGTIFAAVFLVLETAAIAIYIVKCRQKNNTSASTCEEGCVEPEAATGVEGSDDTLPVGNGDTQQIPPLDPSDVASTLAQNKEPHEENHVINMSDLAANSTEVSTDAEPGPDSSQDVRTSNL